MSFSLDKEFILVFLDYRLFMDISYVGGYLSVVCYFMRIGQNGEKKKHLATVNYSQKGIVHDQSFTMP